MTAKPGTPQIRGDLSSQSQNDAMRDTGGILSSRPTRFWPKHTSRLLAFSNAFHLRGRGRRHARRGLPNRPDRLVRETRMSDSGDSLKEPAPAASRPGGSGLSRGLIIPIRQGTRAA